MKRFAALFATLDQTTRTNTKVAALAAYFRDAPEADRLWTIALFSGRRPKRAVTTTRLREWAAERAGIPLWLFEETYPIVGDLAETIALVLPAPGTTHDASLSIWIDRLRALNEADEATRKGRIQAAWNAMEPLERLVFNKLLTGGFRPASAVLGRAEKENVPILLVQSDTRTTIDRVEDVLHSGRTRDAATITRMQELLGDGVDVHSLLQLSQ